jgi:hypothetical protein
MKSVYANKATLLGYGFLGLAGLGMACYFDIPEDFENIYLGIVELTAFLGFSLNILTDFGLQTLKIYQRTRIHIENNGTISEKLLRTVPPLYCDQAGLRLAAKEANLEHLLKLQETI